MYGGDEVHRVLAELFNVVKGVVSERVVDVTKTVKTSQVDWRCRILLLGVFQKHCTLQNKRVPGLYHLFSFFLRILQYVSVFI